MALSLWIAREVVALGHSGSGEASALAQLGVALREAFLYADAERAFADAASAALRVGETPPPGVHVQRGFILDGLGRLDEAVVAYRQAVAAAPHDADTHARLGKALGELHETESCRGTPDGTARHTEALASLREALRLAPRNVDNHIALGDALRTHGKDSEARFAFCEARRLLLETVRQSRGLAAQRRLQLVDARIRMCDGHVGPRCA